MNWLLGDRKCDLKVGIKDDLAIPLMEMLDVPKGSFVFDPYADSRIPAHRVVRLAENIRSAITELMERHRRNIMVRLRLPRWPLWAENVLRVETAKDPLLGVLEKLRMLCTKAIELNCDIVVLGD
jgi:hypothetical protein